MQRVAGGGVGRIIGVFVLLGGLAVAGAAAAETLMLEQPSVARDKIAFVYGGDIWTAERDGANPKRLTSHPATENRPALSPDGQWIAFSANYHGNTDVYLVPAAGGQPRRLTYHPRPDTVRGWTPDGAAVLFASDRLVMAQRGNQLFTVSTDGGFPEPLVLPEAFNGAFSPDGGQIVYRHMLPANWGASGWKRYRGGRTPPLWLFDFETQETETLPFDGFVNTNPMWLGETVYFLSDHDDTVNVYAYDTAAKTAARLTDHTDWDIKNAAATEGAIVYEAGGRLFELDLATNESRPIPISLSADWPQLAPQWKDASKTITDAALSRTGVRAVFAARGDIFTVPADKGDTRNLTKTDAINERDPLWSPDGARLAWLTDASGRFELAIGDQSGLGPTERIGLGDDGYYFLIAWSPDGGAILYEDGHLNVFLLDLETKRSRPLGSHAYRTNDTEAAFSPDGTWLAYAKILPNYMRALMLHDVASGDTHQVTEGMADIGAPVFSRDGKYLYITASTNFGHNTVSLDMSNQDRPIRRGLYAVVLAAGGATPLPPESDEETAEANGEEDGEEEPAAVETRVDLDGLAGRMVALPVAERDYSGLAVAKDGSLFYLDRRQPGITNEPPGSEEDAVNTLMRFDFEKREAGRFMEGVADFTVSGDGAKLLVLGAGGKFTITAAGEKPDDKAKPLDLSGMRAFIAPRAEWRHIFNDVWKLEQAYFYAPGLHGLDWDAIHEKYAPLVDHVARREDLNTLLVDMIGELEAGHNRTGGGDVYRPKRVPVGLLGADFEIADGRYRIARILTGENWNPFLKAPLAEPGLGVSVGDYILAINGRELAAADNIYAFFDGMVDKQVVLTIASRPRLRDGRDITVVPIADERPLRLRTWVETNRKKVLEATDGRVGYVYLPNTTTAGFTYFNRYFFPQVDKVALIIDERFNRGGEAANYITEVLGRPYLASWKDRDGLPFTTPAGVVPGPKVMLINRFAGSGGDFLPWSFRHLGLGPLIGTRTWGGLIGIYANPDLIDGGVLAVPFFRYFTPEEGWTIENEGVAPDIEVEQAPKAVIAGGDPQLERGIAEILKMLEGYESVPMQTPPPDPTELGK